jgi:hypothetical protein
VLDEERMKKLEEELKEARTQAEEADKEQKTDSLHAHLEQLRIGLRNHIISDKLHFYQVVHYASDPTFKSRKSYVFRKYFLCNKWLTKVIS